MKLYTLDNKFIEETNQCPFEFTGIVNHSDGEKQWLFNGKLHRLDGPAVEYPHGSKYWFVDGKLHRLDGPAYEHPDRSKSWYVDGKLHRLDGPAIEYSDGNKFWYVDGKEVTEEQCKLLHDIMKLKELL